MAAALTMLMGSCAQEDLEKGAPEREDCMGVYFVEQQENAKDHTLEKGIDKAELTFKVRRSDATKAAEIPYESSVYRLVKTQEVGDTAYVEEPVYDDSRFKFGKLQFAAGQRETTIKVSFDGISTGERYRCSMSISDPEFAPVYGYTSSSITFSVQINEWVKVKGKALYRDALFTDMLDWKGRHLETEVEIYERKDKKNYFKLQTVYSAAFLARLVEGDEAYNENPEALEKEYAKYIDAEAYIYLDASDSSKVYFPAQKTGFTDSGMGDFYIASDVEEVFSGQSNYLYGTLSKDGVITFPENGLLLGVGGAFYFSNSSGKARIVLPGGKAEDYGFDLVTEDCIKGEGLPVTFTTAKDVTSLKYKVFKGVINDLAVEDSLKVAAESGKVISLTEKETRMTIKPESADAPTGIYTLLVCSFGADPDSYHEYKSVQFGYTAAGDNRDVELYIGLHTDDMLASGKEDENYNSQNSFQYWVRGKDLKTASMAYYPTSFYETYEEQIKESMVKSGSVTSQVLKQINNSVLSGMLGNTLKAGTDYTFVVYAKNDYASAFFTESIRLGGEKDPVQQSYYLSDLRKYEQPSADKYAGEWVAVSTDIFDPEATGRTIRGNDRAKTVKLSVDGDIVTAEGLFPSLTTNPSIKFALKDGMLNSMENKCNRVWVKDSTNIVPSMRFEYMYYPRTGALSSSGYFYENFDDDTAKERRDMFVGGFVHDDVIAFADNCTEFQFWVMLLGGYQKGSMGAESLQNYIGDAHGELILVRKDSPLLKGLTKGDSKVPEINKVLNPLTEASKLTRPLFGIIEGDFKIADTDQGLIEFKDGVRFKTTMK